MCNGLHGYYLSLGVSADTCSMLQSRDHNVAFDHRCAVFDQSTKEIEIHSKHTNPVSLREQICVRSVSLHTTLVSSARKI